LTLAEYFISTWMWDVDWQYIFLLGGLVCWRET